MGPKILCTKKGPTRFSLLQISFSPTVVTLVLGGGEGVLGGGGPLPLGFNYSTDALMKPTEDGLVGGSNPGRANMAAAPPTTVD